MTEGLFFEKSSLAPFKNIWKVKNRLLQSDLKMRKNHPILEKKPKQSPCQNQPKYLPQSLIYKCKISISNHLRNLEIFTTNHV